MNFTHEIKANVLHITAEGDLLGLQNDLTILDFINQELPDEVTYCVIDIGGINYMNSSGLSLLIRILTKFRNRDGDVALVNASDSVKKLLIITKLNAIFNLAGSKEEALAVMQTKDLTESQGFV
jgi:anti-sigma B factor antagonist